MNRRILALTVAAGLATATVVAIPAIASAARPPTYRNCTALNRVYPSGVARPGARDRTVGRAVTGYRVDRRVYTANKRLDRDRDGIACERHAPPRRAPIVARTSTTPPTYRASRPPVTVPRVTRAPGGSTGSISTAPSPMPEPGSVPWVRLSDPTTTTITVDWGLAPGATRYELSWIEYPGGRVWVGRRPTYTDYAHGPVVLTGLRPGNEYTVRVTPYRGSQEGTARYGSGYTLAPADVPTVTPTPAGTTAAPL